MTTPQSLIPQSLISIPLIPWSCNSCLASGDLDPADLDCAGDSGIGLADPADLESRVAHALRQAHSAASPDCLSASFQIRIPAGPPRPGVGVIRGWTA